MSKKFITNTASIKATIADVRNLDAKQIKLKGKSILDYISDSEFDSYDTRDPQLKNDELDIWNTEISLSEEGHIEVKPKDHGTIHSDDGRTVTDYGITDEQREIIKAAVKVIDNEILDENDNHVIYWQTDGLTSSFNFYQFENIVEFKSDLTALTYGDNLFAVLPNALIEFNGNLDNLDNGYQMFVDANITYFENNLPKLRLGDEMFAGCMNLASFNIDMPSLESANSMFYACTSLTSFDSDLSSLTDGQQMFRECSQLTSFSSNLSSLTKGERMFYTCKLDAKSVSNIVHTLSTHETWGSITIGIGCDNTEEDVLLFSQECDCETLQELLDDFSAKNWTAYLSCCGRPTATYNMRRGETLPIYTKLEEVTDDKYAQYTSVDGSKFYNINYFHYTNGSTEGYDVFSSLEEAISTYNVTPKN